MNSAFQNTNSWPARILILSLEDWKEHQITLGSMFDHLKVYPGIVCEFAQSLSGENIPSHPRIQAMISGQGGVVGLAVGTGGDLRLKPGSLSLWSAELWFLWFVSHCDSMTRLLAQLSVSQRQSQPRQERRISINFAFRPNSWSSEQFWRCWQWLTSLNKLTVEYRSSSPFALSW